MLQKNKSKSTSKFKFLIILPLMLAMLTYVSCSNDNEVIKEHTSQLTSEDEMLKESLREELLQMKKDGAKFMAIADAFMTEKDARIKSKESFYRFNVYAQYLSEKMAEREMKKGVWGEEDAKKHKEMMANLKNKTYEDYVAHRKSVKPNSTTTRDQVNEDFNDVPFAVIEEVPVFPGCEDLNSNQERKDCMSEKVTQFVLNNFDASLGKQLGLKGINRVYVQFKIAKDGNVELMGARAPHPALQEEAERVINLLPQMIPGKQKGEEVGVLYTLPITFNAGE